MFVIFWQKEFLDASHNHAKMGVHAWRMTRVDFTAYALRNIKENIAKVIINLSHRCYLMYSIGASTIFEWLTQGV